MFKKITQQMVAVVSPATERGVTGRPLAHLKNVAVAVGTIAAASCGRADASTIGMNALGHGDTFTTFQGCFYVVAGVVVVCYLAYIAYLAKQPDRTTDQRADYEKMNLTQDEYRLLIGRGHPGGSVSVAQEKVPDNLNRLQK